MACFDIAVLPGDGVGPEVVAQGLKVLAAVERRWGHEFRLHEGIIGGAAIDRYGTPLRSETLALCSRSKAVLLGAVGGPKWDDPSAPARPEDGLLRLRRGLGLFANLRPVKVLPCLASSSPLKEEVIRGVDLVFVRELTGGMYFSRPKRSWTTTRGARAVDTCLYTEKEVERVLRVAFELARVRRGKLTSVDKANVLETSRLWRRKTMELSAQYTDVQVEHLLVDACAMHLLRRARDFDVIVTENMFGDILSDEASTLAGSMGMLPSASLGTGKFGLYEPIHGSAPDIAGRDVANPVGTILSVALMLRHSFHLAAEAESVEGAVAEVLERGLRTADIAVGGCAVSTSEMGDAIAAALAVPGPY